jgi:ParB family chromosome partitioning protein
MPSVKPISPTPPVAEIIPTGALMQLSPDDIKPSSHNPRHLFDRPELETLKKNIRDNGVLVPITVYQPKGQTKFSILDGERRYRCVVELRDEGHTLDGKELSIPANVVEPPSKLAGLLYMFSIHNYREAWELMPTALGLKVVIQELHEEDTRALAKLTGLSEPQVERCKKLLRFPEKFQRMSLDPDPKARIPSNFWIEALPVLELIDKELPKLSKELGRDRLTEKLVEKYRDRKIKSVIHFRRIMEGYELSENDAGNRALLLRRLEEFILNPKLETRSTFDEFVMDKKRVQTALEACESFLSHLQQLRLAFTTEDADRAQLRAALNNVRAYCKSLEQALAGTDSPDAIKD